MGAGLWLGVRLEEIPNDVIPRHASRGIEPWVIGNLVRNIHRRVVPVVLPSHRRNNLTSVLPRQDVASFSTTALILPCASQRGVAVSKLEQLLAAAAVQ